MKKELIQSIKIVTLSLIIGLGVSVVYALDWTAPTCAPVGCNTYAPVNVGPDAQTKTGDLNVADVSAFTNGFVSDGQTVITGAAGITSGLHIGVNITSPNTDLYLYKFSASGPAHATTYPAQLCVESDGKVDLCPGPGAATVDITVDTPTISTSEVTSISQSVNLTWTTTNMVGGSCTGTQNNGSTGFTSTPSYAGGTDAATVEKFGTTTYTITCTPTVGAAVTDTVTVVATGKKTLTADGSFTPGSYSDLSSITSYKLTALGGGGAGTYFTGVGSTCLGGADGQDTLIRSGGSTGSIITEAEKGTGAPSGTCLTSTNGAAGNQYTTPPSPNTGAVATVTTGGGAVGGGAMYWDGDSVEVGTGGHSGSGGNGAKTVVSGVSPVSFYADIGLGGSGSQPVSTDDGAAGSAIFSW